MNPRPAAAYLVGLASLEAMWPRRLRTVLSRRDAATAWHALVDGSLGRSVALRRRLRDPEGAVLGAWRRQAAGTDLDGLWARYRSHGVGVATVGSPAYPPAFLGDPQPPAAVFHRGRLDRLGGARVALVGTRRCTRYGREVAYELGAGLAEAGVAVVSGLALGIDGAAHRGALAARGAPPVAVIGSGPDVVYPRANHGLWQAVAESGVLLGEAPLGARPEAWRFPARNRLLAALADVVVVVESHAAGGSMSTVDHALRRDRPVLAVPGPVRSDASRGTNRLLADGAGPVLDVDDVLLALGCTPGRGRRAADNRPAPTPAQAVLLDAVGWQPAGLEQVVARTGLSPPEAAAGLEQLCADGWLELDDGWYERRALPPETS